MKRMTFIAGMTATAIVPLAAHAQPSASPVIGFMSSRSADESQSFVAMFHQGLAEAGYIAGQNVTIEHRWADGRYDRLPALAAELVAQNVSVLLTAGGPPSGLAAKAATLTIPIVFAGTSDAVGLGLVQSLNRPGGNITGISHFNIALAGKRLENLRELIPAGNTFAILSIPTIPALSWKAAKRPKPRPRSACGLRY